MYERMLNKAETPEFDDLVRHSGNSGRLWLELDEYMHRELGATRLIRFPYGNDYGWSAKYSKKSKHICDVFAEDGAFTALFQISMLAVESVHDEIGDYAKSVWANNSPCSSGGWIEFRVLSDEHLQDLQKLITAKVKIRPKKNSG